MCTSSSNYGSAPSQGGKFVQDASGFHGIPGMLRTLDPLGLTKPGPDAPALPAPPPATPTMSDAFVMRARQNAFGIAAQGRESTILTTAATRSGGAGGTPKSLLGS